MPPQSFVLPLMLVLMLVLLPLLLLLLSVPSTLPVLFTLPVLLPKESANNRIALLNWRRDNNDDNDNNADMMRLNRGQAMMIAWCLRSIANVLEEVAL